MVENGGKFFYLFSKFHAPPNLVCNRVNKTPDFPAFPPLSLGEVSYPPPPKCHKNEAKKKKSTHTETHEASCV